MLLIIFILIFLASLFVFLALSSVSEKGWIKRERRIEDRLRGLEEEEVVPSILREELLSEIPAFDSFLDRFNLAHSLNFMLNRANFQIRVGEYILLSLLLMVFGFYFFTRFGFPGVFSILGGILLSLGLLFFVLNRINKRKEKFLVQFPDALDLMSGSLRSGYTLPNSFKILAEEMEDPLGSEFQRAVEQMELGLDIFEVLEKMMEKVDLPDLNLFVTAVRIQKDTGGNLTEILDKISITIREKQKVKGNLRAITAQGRFTGVVLTVLPIIVGIVMYVSSPDYLLVLFQNPLGIKMLQYSAVSIIIGFIMVRKIVTFRGF